MRGPGVVAASALAALALALAAGVTFERLRQRRLRACGCADGECCKSVSVAERRYQLPRAHVEHWDPRDGRCDERWGATAGTSAPGSAPARKSGEGGVLILLRHGQSVWNRKPDRPDDEWRYAGSIDIPLSDVGIQEAFEAGRRLEFTPVDVVFCSQMDRARTTMSLALSVHASKRTPVVEHRSPLEPPMCDGVNDANPLDFIVPVYVTPALNERNFGDLQGVPSSKHTVMFDKEHIRRIRNDYFTKFPGTNGESCADIHARTVPFFDAFIRPHLAAGRNVLVSSHGFVIRTLIKHLDGMDAQTFNDQMKLEKTAPERCLLLAPTGVPLMYKYEDGKFHKLAQSHRERAESLSRSIAPY